MTISLSKLMAVADKATDGPWRTHLVDNTQVVSGQFDIANACSDSDDYDTDYERIEANATHIATFDPPTVKRLLAIARAAAVFLDDCPIGDDDKPYVTDICNGKEFLDLRAALEGVEP